MKNEELYRTIMEFQKEYYDKSTERVKQFEKFLETTKLKIFAVEIFINTTLTRELVKKAKEKNISEEAVLEWLQNMWMKYVALRDLENSYARKDGIYPNISIIESAIADKLHYALDQESLVNKIDKLGKKHDKVLASKTGIMFYRKENLAKVINFYPFIFYMHIRNVSNYNKENQQIGKIVNIKINGNNTVNNFYKKIKEKEIEYKNWIENDPNIKTNEDDMKYVNFDKSEKTKHLDLGSGELKPFFDGPKEPRTDINPDPSSNKGLPGNSDMKFSSKFLLDW